MARCNKCGSGLAPRSAARAALDLKSAEDPQASASRSAARAALDLKGAEDLKASASRCAAGGARSHEQQINNGQRQTHPSHSTREGTGTSVRLMQSP